MGKRDRSTVIGFALFWVVLALGCWLGLHLVQGAGIGRAPSTGAHAASASAGVRHLGVRRAVSHPLTIQSIFSSGEPSFAGYDKHQIRTMIATGDVIPARSVNYMMVTRHDFLYPFRPTAAYVKNADVTLINLESPLISTGCPVTVEGMSFCGDPRVVAGLRFAGVDVACTANNHIGNYGVAAIHETWQHLAAAGIQHCGLGDIAYRSVRGLRFAFLAYNAVGERFDYPAARREIQDARKHADVVVVSVHWGKEYVATPQIAPGIADDNPRQIAHWIVDSGADLVTGNHPHHVQGVEIYHGHLIAYAHGNFVFDQMFTTVDCPGDANYFCSTREGVVGRYTFYGKKLIAVRYVPVVIYNYAQPRWATLPQAKVILAGMKKASLQMAGSR
jgi:poly-gamma-glutamate synthesis protein (capsule biosynthesis protein)